MSNAENKTKWARYNDLFRTAFETCEASAEQINRLKAYRTLLERAKEAEDILLNLPTDAAFPLKEEDKTTLLKLLLPIQSGHDKNFNWPLKYGILGTVIFWLLVLCLKFSNTNTGLHENPNPELGGILLAILYFAFLGAILFFRIRQANKAMQNMEPLARKLYYFSEKKLIESHQK